MHSTCLLGHGSVLTGLHGDAAVIVCCLFHKHTWFFAIFSPSPQVAQTISHLDLFILSYSSWEKRSHFQKVFMNYSVGQHYSAQETSVIVGLLVSLDRPFSYQNHDWLIYE